MPTEETLPENINHQPHATLDNEIDEWEENLDDGVYSEDDWDDFDEPEEEPPYMPEHISLYDEKGTPQERVNVLRNLRDLSPAVHITDDRLEELELGEEVASQNRFFPTLGIEIEVREGYDNDQRRLYAETEKAGVPHDEEPGAWEYALVPVHNPEVLIEEAQALQDLGLIYENHRHPLHLTIGGIKSEVVEGPRYIIRDALLLARTLEATGWGCTASRLVAPDLHDASWAVTRSKPYNSEGVNQRVEYDENGKPIYIGAELRPLEFTTVENLDKTLRAAQYLGAALKSSQQYGETETDYQLQDLWDRFSKRMQLQFRKYDISDPRRGVWKVNKDPDRLRWDDDDESSTDFERLADLLSSASRFPNSVGEQFVLEVRKIVLDYCGRIERVIDESKIGVEAAIS